MVLVGYEEWRKCAKKRSITGVLRTPTPKMPCKSRAAILLISLLIAAIRQPQQSEYLIIMTYCITDLLQMAIRATLILMVKIPDWVFGSIFEGGDTLADGVFGQFSDIMNIELAHYLPAVRFDCFDANMQF